MPRGRKKGIPQTLYSVWRNSDDRLLILDGTAEECAALLGINLKSFYRLVCTKKNAGYGFAYTINKIDRRQAELEAGG